MSKLVDENSKRSKFSPKKERTCIICGKLLLVTQATRRLVVLGVRESTITEDKGKSNMINPRKGTVKQARTIMSSRKLLNRKEKVGFTRNTEKVIANTVESSILRQNSLL